MFITSFGEQNITYKCCSNFLIHLLRPATEQEKLKVNLRIQSLKWTKGSKLIWSDFTHVREFKVNNYRWIKYPNMMDHLT